MRAIVMTRRMIGAALCALILIPSAWPQEAQPPLQKEEIEQLVAPIALYPDALVAQILMASTYPVEIVAAARWSQTNPKVTGKALEDAMQNETWDPSVKSLTAVPQVLAMMNEKLDWTQKLGDAFLAQQKEVMDATQRLRAKAKDAGNLKSSKEQVVKTEQEDGTTVIIIEPADPQVVYVPTYNPTVVYGAWPYPAYPPYYYYPPGYAAGAAVFTFSVGLFVGSAMWGGVRWGGSSANVYINTNNYNRFNRTNVTNVNNVNWQHNPEHRKGTQYRDPASQNRYGGGARTGVDTREAYRGRAEAGSLDVAGGAQRSSAFDGAGGYGGEARAQSSRGASSVASAGGSARGAGAARGGGGGRGGGGRR
ncbi:MAG: DUF3300 domain-containing protein [Sulfurifustaceae bacterium]